MKMYCIVGKSRESQNVCYSYNHMYLPLAKYGNCYTGEFQENTTHVLFIDVIQNVGKMRGEINEFKKNGIKIIGVTFDPANFADTDCYIAEKLLDKLFLFDKQFKNRFDFNVCVSDLFLNQDLFPPLYEGEHNGVCYFGHLIKAYERTNEYNLPVIEDFSSYPALYEKVQKYNGVCVYDTGRGEDPNVVVHHNKAKALEALMCGVNAYCQDGIKTINYDKYLKKFDQIPNPVPIDFDREEIFKINEKVVKEFLTECEK